MLLYYKKTYLHLTVDIYIVLEYKHPFTVKTLNSNRYLERISAALESARASTDGAPITLLAHSAGGWLGRLHMLAFGTKDIDQFVSLGSPHLPPPEGVIDQTRGKQNKVLPLSIILIVYRITKYKTLFFFVYLWVSGILRYIEANCPGSHHSSDGVQYITIAGRYIKGAPLLGPGSWQQRVVGAGYQQVCGEAEVWGDGVVPVPAAHLDGALNITIEGVYHSPLGAISDAEQSQQLSAGTLLIFFSRFV